MGVGGYLAEHTSNPAARPRRRIRARWVVLALVAAALAVYLVPLVAERMDEPGIDEVLATDAMTSDREDLGLKYELDSVREDEEGRTVYRFVASEGADGPLELPVPLEITCDFYWVTHVGCPPGGIPIFYDPGWHYRIGNWDEYFYTLAEDGLLNRRYD